MTLRSLDNSVFRARWYRKRDPVLRSLYLDFWDWSQRNGILWIDQRVEIVLAAEKLTMSEASELLDGNFVSNDDGTAWANLDYMRWNPLKQGGSHHFRKSLALEIEQAKLWSALSQVVDFQESIEGLTALVRLGKQKSETRDQKERGSGGKQKGLDMKLQIMTIQEMAKNCFHAEHFKQVFDFIPETRHAEFRDELLKQGVQDRCLKYWDKLTGDPERINLIGMITHYEGES